MKTLKFAADLVLLITSGSKTATWRLFDDKDLQVGDELIFINQASGQEFATARIVAMKEKALGDIVENDFKGHELFESPEKMLETYRQYYGKKVDKNTLVKMLDFDILQLL